MGGKVRNTSACVRLVHMPTCYLSTSGICSDLQSTSANAAQQDREPGVKGKISPQSFTDLVLRMFPCEGLSTSLNIIWTFYDVDCLFFLYSANALSSEHAGCSKPYQYNNASSQTRQCSTLRCTASSWPCHLPTWATWRSLHGVKNKCQTWFLTIPKLKKTV